MTVVKHSKSTPTKKVSKLWIILKFKFSKKMFGKLGNVMKGVFIKCQSNAVSYFQITGTLNLNQKIQTENSILKIVVTNSKSTPVEKWVNCELQITIFTENSWDAVANVMKNVFMKFKSNLVTQF